MGRYLEDFRVGEVIKHWPGRTVRDFDDTWFTLLTMNTNPLHLDEHFASQSQHGRCLVNGTLVFALAVGMSVRDISENALANLEYEKVVHLGPTFHGDTIYAESEILEVTPSTTKRERGVVSGETRAVNQKGERVLSLRRRVLIPRRPTWHAPKFWAGVPRDWAGRRTARWRWRSFSAGKRLACPLRRRAEPLQSARRREGLECGLACS